MAHLDIAHWQNASLHAPDSLLALSIKQEPAWTAAMSKTVYFHQAFFSVRHMHVWDVRPTSFSFCTGADILQLEMADAHCLATDRSSEPNGHEAMGPSA